MTLPDAARARDGEWRAAVIAFGVLLVAWFPRLSPVFASPDDLFRFRTGDAAELWRLMLMQGRFGQAAVYSFLGRLGVDPVSSGTLLNWFALALLAASAVGVLRCWRLPATPLSAMGSALIFVHPTMSELFGFRSVPFFFALAALLAVAGLALVREGRMVAAVALIAVSLSLYQLTFSLVLVLCLVGVALECASGRPASGALRAWARPLLSLALAAAGYWLAQRLVIALLGLEPLARARLVDAAGLVARGRELRGLLARALWREPVLSTPWLGGLQVLLVTMGLATCAHAGWRQRSLAGASLAAGCLLLAVGATVGLTLLPGDFWPAPRLLTAAGALFAGLVFLSASNSSRTWRVVAAVVSGALLLGYAGIDHRVASDQVRVNQLDLQRAGRIVARLEVLPGWKDVRRVTVLGHPSGYPGIPHEFDLNVSGFARAWSQLALLEWAAGRPLELPGESDLGNAERTCAHAERWPAPASVSIAGALATVCF